jgi:hypothetical protein
MGSSRVFPSIKSWAVSAMGGSLFVDSMAR